MTSEIGHKWMSYVSDGLKLSELTIPGTHNTCATQTIAKCQSMPLRDQLNAGVRFLDVRCRHIEDRFDIYHSSFDLNQRFDLDVAHVCVEFLKSNPSETLVMLASTEHLPKNNTLAFDDVFHRYVEVHRSFWYLSEHVPTLRECRGRIVLLRRFRSDRRPFGIDMSGWHHNGPCHIKNHPHHKFHVQDVFKLTANQKWQHVKETLGVVTSSSNEMPHTMYLNYCSAQNWPLQPPFIIAMVVNRQLKAYLDEREKSGSKCQLGVIILDFVNPGLVEKLFLFNLRDDDS
jgi:1-phosphatidylinositol phosphodiesterase